MAQGMILRRGGGGVNNALALHVQTGTVQPTGEEGLLWVKTSTACNYWSVAIAQPSSPATGDVWVQADATSANIVELLLENSVRINVARVMQYNGSAWSAMDASIYQNGAWVVISYARVYLYDNGQNNTAVGGGLAGNALNNGSIIPGGTFGAAYIEMVTGGSGQMANASASKIDLTAFNTLTIVYDVVATSISPFRLVVNSTARDVYTLAAGVLGYATRTETAVISNQTLVVDVSAMNQQAYIAFGGYAFGTVRVKAVYLA